MNFKVEGREIDSIDFPASKEKCAIVERRKKEEY